MSQWFEMSTGSLVVGEAAYAERFEQALPGDLVPLADLLLGNVSMDGATRAPEGTYEKYPTDNELELYGAWLLKIMRSQDQDAVVSSNVLRRAHNLGLGIGADPIGRHFGTLHELRSRIDVPHFAPDRTYAHWTLENFVENASNLAASIKWRKPEVSDYREWARLGNGPGPSMIRALFRGGVTYINSSVGFPNIRAFEYEDFIDWGVRFMLTNNGKSIDTAVLMALSKRSCGPSEALIYKHFGAIPKFASIVNDNYRSETAEKNAHTADLLASFDELRPFSRIGVESWGEERKKKFVAKLLLAKRCLPLAPRNKIESIATNSSAEFCRQISQTNPGLSNAHIELIADGMGLFDDIWPPYPNDNKILRLTDTEYEKARLARIDSSAKTRAARRAKQSLAQSHQSSRSQSRNAA